MRPEQLRKRLGLTPAELARALNVSLRTIYRWEEGIEPQGVASEVFRGIELALAEGVDPAKIGNALRFGVATLLRLGFTNGFAADNPTKRTPT